MLGNVAGGRLMDGRLVEGSVADGRGVVGTEADEADEADELPPAADVGAALPVRLRLGDAVPGVGRTVPRAGAGAELTDERVDDDGFGVGLGVALGLGVAEELVAAVLGAAAVEADELVGAREELLVVMSVADAEGSRVSAAAFGPVTANPTTATQPPRTSAASRAGRRVIGAGPGRAAGRRIAAQHRQIEPGDDRNLV